MKKKIILLGSGITGKYVTAKLEQSGYDVYPTSRRSEKFHNNQVLFDLENSETWKNLPLNAEIIWIFSPTPISSVSRFLEFLPKEISVRMVLGTTSVYVQRDGTVTEQSEIDEANERLQSEKILLDFGAVILRCSGLYSQERHPYQWLKNDRILNGNKSVNLIHQMDLAKIISRLLDTDIKSETFNISDGRNYLWKDIVQTGKEKKIIPEDFVLPESEIENRVISNEKILNILNHDFQFHDEGWKPNR